jgi:hypothetical protein
MGVVGNSYQVAISASGLTATAAPKLAYAKAATSAGPDPRKPTQITVTYADAASVRFIVDDTVALVRANGTTVRNRVIGVSRTDDDLVVLVTLESALPPGALPPELQMARISNTQRQIRVVTPSGAIQAGGLVQIEVTAGTPYFAIVERTDADGFIFLRSPFQQEDGSAIPATPTSFVAIDSSPALRNLDFGITVTGPDGKILDEQMGLSLNPFHGGYVFRRDFKSVRVLRPKQEPSTTVFVELQLPVGNLVQAVSRAMKIEGEFDNFRHED